MRMLLPNISLYALPENYGFFINHSGGKDSQAMYLSLKGIIPPERLFIIYADLGKYAWSQTIDHIKNTLDSKNQMNFYVVKAPKTFGEMWNHRKKPPSPSTRQCTSDLKRAPIEK